MMISGSNFSKNKITAVMIEYSEKKVDLQTLKLRRPLEKIIKKV